MSELERLRKSMARKCKEIATRVATHGAFVATEGFRNAIYDGDNDVTVNIDAKPQHTTLVAEGRSVLFIEFGAGAMYGYGHPQATEFNFGPGTYSDTIGSGHWANPGGWWWTDAAGKHHSYGNSPAMVMYRAAKEMRQVLPEVAREVFKA